jgi:hypothetical protein
MPDLSDPAAREAYRGELRRLARGPRWLGLFLVALGAGGLIYAQTQGVHSGLLRPASWTAMAAGWTILIAVMIYRTRYHKARMAEDHEL